MKARSRTRPSGALPGYFKLLNVQAMIFRCSMTGTTKPKLSSLEGKSARDTIDTFLHAAGESDEQTPAGATAILPVARPSSLLRPHRPNDAALGPFHFLEARHRCGQAELVRIRRVDAADERLGDAFQSFGAESTANE